MSKLPFERPHALIISHPRSGTHFLQSSLESHPRVHGRGECVLRYRRNGGGLGAGEGGLEDALCLYRNMPRRLNVAIVMYFELGLYHELCGTLDEVKVVHLIRNPKNVALSLARMSAAKRRLGPAFRAHYTLEEAADPAPLDESADLAGMAAGIAALQRSHAERLARHRNALTVSYEDLTRDAQVNRMDPAAARQLLSFLGLPYAPLTNRLQKTPALAPA